MPEPTLYVDVSWREILILEEAPLGEPSVEEAFLATDAPLPVGTMVILSPTEAEEIRVPARVVCGQEALSSKNVEPKTPGMKLLFEAAGELLAPYLPGAEPEPDEATATEESAGEGEFSPNAIPESASRASGDYAEISADAFAPEAALGDPDPEEYEEEPRYELDASAEPDEAAPSTESGGNSGPSLPTTAAGAMDSAIAPQASGEIQLSVAGGSRHGGDSEAPDKVIVEVEDPAMKAATTSDDDLPPFDDTGEETKVENKKRKKRSRSRGKKKKKKK
jgi:hypothetical protein